ncbi:MULTISPECIES: hypothetical protein [unclassified Mesorhizobium]|uniref:hypothetical protein n=1 Tax=unclassified Mesorhizobium TaxID=325217 RepID=UPI000FCB1969|nr:MULTISPECIES: hypothetical protein [unclassified Mesorhizobium]RUV45068.1 hypothetical protein EOD29_10100 [Mesorhizobium sp. M1A.T.Ca.IN.004.03.1.1]RWG06316.1 MAG: hypothetical protein EOQ54_08660 [Mesorhizobium sp.]RWH03337.1 MAG: hypothetical protein EOQ72_01875 [Mesorhizobium sp.]RWI97546.1 MAG: hypothetical protein EOR22_04130 [Mesorhizobium sp.]RWK28344.1 MAG: hypothetical protein EOR40_28620 [Mesorhizobium sp.]
MNSLHLLEAFLLFAAPGPTNALLMVGAVKREKAIALLIAQACGYGVASACWFSLRPLVSPGAVLRIELVAAGLLVVLGLRLMSGVGANTSKKADAITVFATSAINPKGFIYCLAMVPTDAKPQALGVYWVVLLATTAVTGTFWILLGSRFSGGRTTVDWVAGAALIAFAVLLLGPLIPLAAT